MTNQEIAKQLIELIGGKDNIKSVNNCMTRCRLELEDTEMVDIAKIKKSEGALGAVISNGQVQVIYGPGKASKVAEEVRKIVGISMLIGDEAVKATKANLKSKCFKKIRKYIYSFDSFIRGMWTCSSCK